MDPDEASSSNFNISFDSNHQSTSQSNHIREELSEMSFEELQQLKNKLGTKLYNKAVLNRDSKKSVTLHRENKNRPREESSKKQVSRLREIFPTAKKVSRDPRFDDLSGVYNPKLFKTNYGFLSEIKTREKEELKKELRNETISSERRAKVKELLSRINNQERAEQEKDLRETRAAEQKAERIEALKEGRKPHYQNKSTTHKLELAAKFHELKKGNKLDKYLVRKRKKVAGKEKKKFKK